jgi:hypothetical protein
MPGMDPLALLLAHDIQRRALDGATTGPAPRRRRPPKRAGRVPTRR